MKPNLRPNRLKFAKRNHTTVLAPKYAKSINYFFATMLFALTFIIVLMLASYSPEDSCWSKTFDSPIVHNVVGTTGAWISDILLYLFGYSAWWISAGVFYLGYRKIMRNKIPVGNWNSIYQVISFLFLISFSASFEYLVGNGVSSILPNKFGGAIGAFMVMTTYHVFGEVGTVLLSFFIALLCFSFAFSFPWGWISQKIGAGLEIIFISLSNLFKQKNHTERTNESNYQVVNETFSVAASHKEDVTPFQEDNFDIEDNKLSEDYFYENNFESEKQIEDTIEQNLNLENLAGIDDANKKFDLDELSEPDFNFDDFPKLSRNTHVEHVLPELKPQKSAALYSYEPQDLIENISQASLPSTALLDAPSGIQETVSPEVIDVVSRSIENTLADFNIDIQISNVESGPVITRYELMPPKGIRGDKIASYAKEIARGLTLPNIRIVENIVGKSTMGIEVPNYKRQTIYLKEIFESKVYRDNNSLLTLALGKDIAGQVVVTDLAKMPHLLVAGTTGSGKSVSVNAMILSILFNARADEVKFIMIDPKMVELSFYEDIPHLLAPVVTDMSQAANALKWTVGEMERRYKLMAKFGTKKIVDFNKKIDIAESNGKPLYNPFNPDLNNPEQLEKWPFIVVIIDELADLMMVAGKKIEQYIARIAQKARAVGIHLIVATQRPSVDVITGLIKANIPARIGFQVASRQDSGTIIGQNGAEALLGQGDMLFLSPGSGFPRRIHGAFVNDDELHRIVEFLKTQGSPVYNDEILTGEVDVLIPGVEDDASGSADNGGVESDPIFDQAVKFILDSKRCSISSLQTQFGIGYNKAARIMNHLEKIGMVRRNERGGFELLNHTLNQ